MGTKISSDSGVIRGTIKFNDFKDKIVFSEKEPIDRHIVWVILDENNLVYNVVVYSESLQSWISIFDLAFSE